MKFWKPLLLTSVFLLAITSTVIFTACEQDKCNGVTCNNGGSCNAGVCKCPSGFEGPTCASLTVTRYIGYYAGYSTCNNGAQIIDTVFISIDNPKIKTSVRAWESIHPTDTLRGYVTSNETAYQMFLGNITYTNYNKSFHITLQNDNSLVLNSYEANYTNPADTIVNSCAFTGVKGH